MQEIVSQVSEGHQLALTPPLNDRSGRRPNLGGGCFPFNFRLKILCRPSLRNPYLFTEILQPALRPRFRPRQCHSTIVAQLDRGSPGNRSPQTLHPEFGLSHIFNA